MKTKFLIFLIYISFSNTFSQTNSKQQVETKFRLMLDGEFDSNTINKGEVLITKETYDLITNSDTIEKDVWLCVFDDSNGVYYQLVLDYLTNEILFLGYQIDYKGSIPFYKGLKNINFDLLLKKFKDTADSVPSKIRIVKKEVNYKAIGISKDHYIKLQDDNFKMYLNLYTYERL